MADEIGNGVAKIQTSCYDGDRGKTKNEGRINKYGIGKGKNILC